MGREEYRRPLALEGKKCGEVDSVKAKRKGGIWPKYRSLGRMIAKKRMTNNRGKRGNEEMFELKMRNKGRSYGVKVWNYCSGSGLWRRLDRSMYKAILA
jgi:hypothetical protein